MKPEKLDNVISDSDTYETCPVCGVSFAMHTDYTVDSNHYSTCAIHMWGGIFGIPIKRDMIEFCHIGGGFVNWQTRKNIRAGVKLPTTKRMLKMLVCRVNESQYKIERFIVAHEFYKAYRVGLRHEVSRYMSQHIENAVISCKYTAKRYENPTIWCKFGFHKYKPSSVSDALLVCECGRYKLNGDVFDNLLDPSYVSSSWVNRVETKCPEFKKLPEKRRIEVSVSEAGEFVYIRNTPPDTNEHEFDYVFDARNDLVCYANTDDEEAFVSLTYAIWEILVEHDEWGNVYYADEFLGNCGA